MRHNRQTVNGYRSVGRACALALGAALAAGALAGCDTLLEVEAPGTLEEKTLFQPANAQVIVAGVTADFECAFTQYVAVMGTVADEFGDAQANAATWDIDRRTAFPNTTLYSQGQCGGFGGVYTPVSIARFSADNALKLLDGWTDEEVPGRATLIARSALYSGYSHILLGEGFCSAAIDRGPELTPAQVFALAEARFTRAIEAATAPGDVAIKNAALVGRARARVNQGKLTEAAADAALVPDGFVFNANYSSLSGRSENRVFRSNNSSGTITADPAVRGLNDPRVPVSDAGRGGSLPTVRLWTQNKYTSLSSPIPIATWREAVLIRAEAAGGQTAVTLLNQLRARAGVALGPLSVSTGDPAAVRAALVEERRRELFLESHRLFDTIRFNVALSPAAGAPFPNGGGTYGSLKCLPLPDVERVNNPNIGSPTT
ncbi:MAG: RagB/SusD family nutrient uptake outer membrane protein [Gemmatimonadaceae bacterium]